MKRFPSLLLGLSLCAAPVLAAAQQANTEKAAAPTPARTQALESIVAVVNNEVITRTELDAKLATVEQQLRRQGTSMPERALLERQVLEQVIIERVQEQQAKEAGITVDDVQVDRAVQRIAEQNKMSMNDFRARLEQEGMAFEKFRRDVRQEILLVRLRQQEVDNRVQVSEGEIDNFLADRKGAAAGATEINIAQIMVRVPEGSSPDTIGKQRAKAEDLHRQLKSGADFAKLAVSFSDSADALKGGELGYRLQERWPQLFLQALRGLNPGQISGVVQSPAGFHILKLLDQRQASETAALPPVEQTHARHILIRPNELISSADAKRRLTELLQRLRNGAKFEDLARQFSADGNAAQGGDLGWLYPGDTVPEFQRAMDALKPGDLSEPIETPYGWHLIQVLERRTQDVSSERQRLMARQALRERKADEAYEDWVRQMRDRAYVEIRLDSAHS